MFGKSSPQFQGTDFGSEVRKDFRDTMKRMFPNSEDYKAVLSQHTKFTNKEGIYGDADIMSLTQDDSEHAIPTYQFWSEHGHEKPLLAKSSAYQTGSQIVVPQELGKWEDAFLHDEGPSALVKLASKKVQLQYHFTYAQSQEHRNNSDYFKC
ncbi:hypothetical protein WJX82_000786 [Trebouxia sp. C0006]